MRLIIRYFLALTVCPVLFAQDSPAVPLQPFALHVRQLEDALDYLGQALPAPDQKIINDAIGQPGEAQSVGQIERVLDKYVLCLVDINAESRVKVEAGPAKPELVEG